MFGWLTSFKILIYLIVVLRVCSYSSVYLNFLIATKLLFSISLHFKTTPYAPSPIAESISYFCIMYRWAKVIIIKLYRNQSVEIRNVYKKSWILKIYAISCDTN